jgi:hypothetical protein
MAVVELAAEMRTEAVLCMGASLQVGLLVACWIDVGFAVGIEDFAPVMVQAAWTILA